MTSRNSETSPEYRDAMRLFRQLAQKHGLKVSPEQRKIFWAGVIYGAGKERSRRQGGRCPLTETLPHNAGTTPIVDETTEPELDKGGMFQL